MKKLNEAVMACALGWMALGLVAPSARGTMTTLLATQDVFVNPTYTSTTEYILFTGTNTYGEHYSYIKFDLSSLVQPGYITIVNSVSLSLFKGSSLATSPVDGLYAVADDSWTEAAMTWANKPALGSELATWSFGTDYTGLTIPNTAGLQSFVAAEVAGDQIVSFGMKQDSAGAGGTSAYYGNNVVGPDLVFYTEKLIVDYTLFPIPEPSVVGLLGVAAVTLWARRRGRKME